MTFEENPFRILNVSIYDTKETIVERADDLSFMEPDDEKIIDDAKNILLNPRKRIAAEVRWFVGDKLNTENILEDILRVDKNFSALNVGEIRDQINAARKKSKFPAVQDNNAIKDELKNLRGEIRETIQDCLNGMTFNERVKWADDIADELEFADSIGIVAEDFFDSYRLEMTAFLDETTEKIRSLSSKFEFKFKAEFSQYLYELEPSLTAFAKTRKSLDKFSIALGTNKFDETEEIFYAVRSTAISLYNDKKLIDYPLTITRLLEKNFSYLPKLAEKICEDVKFLEEAKASQPTQLFLEAKSAFEKIMSAIDDRMHFESGFEQANYIFFVNFFKPTHEVTLRKFMGRQGYKPDEWKRLNWMAAVIYNRVGSAMTWTPHSDLTYEMFREALPFAETSDDAELFSLVKKNADKWRKIANPDSDGCGCLGGCWLAILISGFFSGIISLIASFFD